MLEKVSEPDKQTSRDDWNEVASIALVDAWSKKCRQLNKSNLKLAHWAELADTVRVKSNTRKTDVQCKNRVDTLKKKYKHEKQKQALGSISKWPYFSLLDNMLNSTPWHGGLPSTANAGQIKEINLHHPIEISNHSLNSSRTKKTHILIPTSALRGEGVFDEDAGSTKRMRKDDSYNKVVSRAIVKFGEMFEKLEKSKQQQLTDLEKTRKELSKDLERQRIKLFMQAQIELAKLKRGTVNFDESVSKMNR
ncbi:hypothetical protein O6H91_11G072100 [Diphasiastrum complanatum]|uniref:Uncharacterized protein n=1 Tax=Diphasiastrum complanatum TaxID=34168 RepID=A0ACC2CAC7_DIPCM|nr:hypothetical protein O6H91_11G072100 [Diphasiastrum complanatum]